MLRTCNALRIAGLPVLRNDGAGLRPPLRPPTPPYASLRLPQPPSKLSSLIFDI
ncbi:MAG: hypothetical protein LBM98_00410 [Oscillospiraceae bacterium]|nr:hypothetical protein [Oscillospiraceae bacterium]